MLPTLALARVRLTYRLRDPMPQGAVQGGLWRGAMGYALKLSLCAYTDPFQRPCRECVFYHHCAYPPLFEPIVPADQAAATSDDASRPFVLEPPFEAMGHLRAGDMLPLGMVLMGPALEDLPALIRALALMGERGLGRQQARASLINVEALTFQGTQNLWPQGSPGPLPMMSAENIAQAAEALPADLTLRFVTPTRLKIERTIVTVPNAEIVVRALLRRLISLSALYATPWYPETHRLITLATTLPTQGELDWRVTSHTSSRQKRRLPLDGFEGVLMLRSVPVELRALFLLGSFVHIGKLATYGHGWYLLEGTPLPTD